MKGYKVESIPALYKNCQAIVVAPGPSLTPTVVEQLRSVKHKYAIVGVGDVYKLIDFMDEHYACDARWWKFHGPKINKMRPGLSSWCHDEEGMNYGAKQINSSADPGFSTDPSKINQGANSGFQALNLAYLFGFTKMYLVGYNMQRVQNKTHFFDDRTPSLAINSPYGKFAANYNQIQPDIRKRIINCTPNSALKCFQKQNLESLL